MMRPDALGQCDRFDVTIMDLVVQPDAWDDKLVRTKGFLHADEDFAMLCDAAETPPTSRQGADCVLVSLLDSPGLAIDPSAGEHVRIEGTFDADRQGRMRKFSGTIANTSSVERVR